MAESLNNATAFNVHVSLQYSEISVSSLKADNNGQQNGQTDMTFT
jgi:hypothetical protein